MDHSWGLNLLAYGLTSSGATLAARELSDPFRFQVVTNLMDEDGFVWCPVLPDVENHAYSHDYTYVGLGARFPYGFHVEPDAHV